MRSTAAILLAAMPMGLGACSDSRVVAHEPTSAYSMNEVRYAASERDLRVVVHGNPFGGNQAAFAAAVADAMQNHIMGIRTNFTTMPNQSARPDYNVVVVFNPVQTSMMAQQVCGQPSVPTLPPSGGRLMALAAFCRSGALTSATGWLEAPPAAPGDRKFRDFIGDLTFALFPADKPDRSCVTGLFGDC